MYRGPRHTCGQATALEPCEACELADEARQEIDAAELELDRHIDDDRAIAAAESRSFDLVTGGPSPVVPRPSPWWRGASDDGHDWS